MVSFLTSVFRSNRIEDGTRRAAMETVILARQDLQAASSRLNDTINDLIRENDRVTRRQQRNEKFIK
jgi:hypothetical protein